MNDAELYMRWLVEMWDVQKFDPHGGTEREEQRKEQVLEICEQLGESTRCRVEAPCFAPWEPFEGSNCRVFY